MGKWARVEGKGKGWREFYQTGTYTKTVQTIATPIHARGWYGGALLFVHFVSVVPSCFLFFSYLSPPLLSLPSSVDSTKRKVSMYRILTAARIATVSRIAALSRGREYHDDGAGGANRVDAIVLHAYVGAGRGGVAGADGFLCGRKLEREGVR